MTEIVLRVDDLTVSYNGSHALEGVSLAVHEGEQVAVVGPNGAGKSTFFKALVGLIPRLSGTISTEGAEVAYVPQRSGVDWSFPVTVNDVVMMGRIGKMGWLRWHGPRDREIVQRSLAQVGMTRQANRQIGELSGGQQQRVFIARALAQEARILLMDEPFSGVDAAAQEAILDLLHTLPRQGVTVLVSTHDLNLAVERFDRIALLNRRLVAYGLPREVIRPETLAAAYGGQALWRGEDYALVLGDIDCCGEGEHHHG
ncbi:metal ABC transporter ATP-binding protein [Candidatus Bathyarchaeota archaeon]|nr:metal ABC transporter ATP-binding protein [Candidatus Bathyarchaeota archaeon]